MREFFVRFWSDWQFAKMTLAPVMGLLIALGIAYAAAGGKVTLAAAIGVGCQYLFSMYGVHGGYKSETPPPADLALPKEKA